MDEQLIYTGVGSRSIPCDKELHIVKLGRHLADLNVVLRSGGADGSDSAFNAGAVLSKNFNPSLREIYIAWEGASGLHHNPKEGIICPTGFANYNDAREIARQARGSFEGLGRGGIALHTRNTYQVLGQSLTQPADFLICYAVTVGNKGMVKGGTNTAVQIANKHAIPVINLFTKDGLDLSYGILECHDLSELKTYLSGMKS